MLRSNNLKALLVKSRKYAIKKIIILALSLTYLLVRLKTQREIHIFLNIFLLRSATDLLNHAGFRLKKNIGKLVTW